MPERWDLKQRQALPLSAKILMSTARIREWYDHWDGQVYVSFSGGKDSTVLADLVRSVYPDVPIVFSNTGLEFPEIQRFARESGAKVIVPEKSFTQVLTEYGYPVVSKETAQAIDVARRHDGGKWREQKRDELMGVRMNGDKRSAYNKEKWLPLCRDTDFRISDVCCKVMKKRPFKQFEHEVKRHPYIGNIAEESRLREQAWLRNGCNAFEIDRPVSQPIAFWREQDVLEYIRQNELRIASVYGEIVSADEDGMEYLPMPGVTELKCSGYERTGCIFCGFSTHLEKGETKFQKLKKTHPKQYDFCMRGGQYIDNPDYDPDLPEYDGSWKNWNPEKIWVPSKEGLGMRHVFEQMNEIYGKDFIRFE